MVDVFFYKASQSPPLCCVIVNPQLHLLVLLDIESKGETGERGVREGCARWLCEGGVRGGRARGVCERVV